MNPRDQILEAVRAALGRPAVDAGEIDAQAARLLDDLPLARPDLDGQSVLDVFRARVVSPKVAATLETLERIEDLPAAVARYLAAQGLARSIALQPSAALQALDWQQITLHEAPDKDEPVGVGIADAGIAETGSLVFLSGPQTPVLAHFVPVHHLVLVRESTIVMYLDDYAATSLRPQAGSWRNVNLVTGASGTTDIEGSLVRGAHGPRYLHVLVLRDASRR